MSIVSERIAKGICSIIINRPEKRNALNTDLIKRLQSAIHEFEYNDNYKIAILSGAGGNFCSGYDLNEVIDKQTGMPNVATIEQMLWPMGTWLSEKKIVIAAVTGHAAGFGFELALKCDFRILDRDSRMGFLNRRFGIPIMNGGTVMLPRMTNQPYAMDLIATGRPQLAPEAKSFGLTFHVSDVGCSVGRSLNLARSLVKFNLNTLMNDLNHLKLDQNRTDQVIHLLTKERLDSLNYLKNCVPLDTAKGFLEGRIGRHGSSDLGNLVEPNPEVTL